MLKNTNKQYGNVSVSFHWLSAILVVGMFVLGWWMLTLTYYDEWYRLGPWWHKSIGIALFVLTVLRLFWKQVNPLPAIEGTPLEQKGAKLGHGVLYTLLFVVMISGYLISTADGSSISVFGWFDVPGYSLGIENQEDIAGIVHWYAALTLVILAVGHALMAIKHHVINKDNTLRKMFYKT
jgi:cytochrome b561